MKKVRFVLPALLLAAATIVAFASASKESGPNGNPPKQAAKLAPMYFVFNGSTTGGYTDSTQWQQHPSNPGPACPGNNIACLVSSLSLTTRTQLVNAIQANGGDIPSSATVEDRKN